MDHLADHLENSREPKYPTEVGDIRNLLEMFRDFGMRHSPIFEVKLKYSDSLGTSKYESEICKGRLDVEEEKLDKSFRYMKTISERESIREKILIWISMRTVNAVHSSYWEITPPYETDISAPVFKTDSSVELTEKEN
jgi:hypothetical protein